MTEHRVELPEPFPPGARKLAFVDGRQVLIFNIHGILVAIENACPHAGGSLHAGKIEGQILRCPSHGMRFDLLSEATELRTYRVAPAPGGALLSL